jgi:cytochrome c553
MRSLVLGAIIAGPTSGAAMRSLVLGAIIAGPTSGAAMRSLVLGAIIAGLPALPLCAQSLDERLPTCFACHGEKGTSQVPETPSLGAQPAFYTTVQLLMFRDRLRVSEPMNEMTKGLSDGDLQKAADVISKLPPPEPISDNSNSARMERGRALGQQHRCNFCHQSNYAGQENVPRLAGQREDYLLKALRGYKDNSRYAYDAQMADVIYPLKDEDFADLAYFLARVK